MARDFLNLISELPSDLSVLDVGGFGLEGENTSNALAEKFSNMTVVNKQPEVVEEYSQRYPKITFINDLYENLTLPLYDLVVFDAGIESQMKMWENLDTVPTRKYLAAYFMLTDKYGDEDTPRQIREHWDVMAQKTLGWKLIKLVIEERRPEILWLLLERTDG